VDEKKIEKSGKTKEVYLYFNRSGEIVRVVMRELEQNCGRCTSFQIFVLA